MTELDAIGERILRQLMAKNEAREEALALSRQVIQRSAKSTLATHRRDRERARGLLQEAREEVSRLRRAVEGHPEIYFSGYVQDALKEYAEASIAYALTVGDPPPGPDELGVECAPYLNGLGEAAGELRRYILDSIRLGEVERCEELLQVMEEIYSLLITVDFPDALTGGLRRTTDMVRGVLERTRGDLTLTLQQLRLERALQEREKGG